MSTGLTFRIDNSTLLLSLLKELRLEAAEEVEASEEQLGPIQQPLSDLFGDILVSCSKLYKKVTDS